jgi:hypothetical protein
MGSITLDLTDFAALLVFIFCLAASSIALKLFIKNRVLKWSWVFIWLTVSIISLGTEFFLTIFNVWPGGRMDPYFGRSTVSLLLGAVGVLLVMLDKRGC